MNDTKVLYSLEQIELIRNTSLDSIDMTKDINDEQLYTIIDNSIADYAKNNPISLNARYQIRKKVYSSIRGMDVLDEFLEDDSITEIMVNNYKEIFIERGGSLYKSDLEFIDQSRLDSVIQSIVARVNRSVNKASPIVDARLDDGSRINAVLEPIALKGSTLTIRKFTKQVMSMKELIARDTISNEAAQFLIKLVQARYNIFISGGTGSGKTTFLNILSDYIPKNERVITIEDSAELKLSNVDNLVSLESREGNAEGENAISIRDLIKTSLRMRPDRIIVGECRGEEAVDMLTAMLSGHDGSLSTGHANSSEDMIKRLETMILMGSNMTIDVIRSQIESGIDIYVHLSRVKDKSRKVMSISQIAEIKDGKICLEHIFIRNEKGLVKVGELRNKNKLNLNG